MTKARDAKKNLQEALQKYRELKSKRPEELTSADKLHIENMEYLATWKNITL